MTPLLCHIVVSSNLMMGLIAIRNKVKIKCREAPNSVEITLSTDVPTGIDRRGQ